MILNRTATALLLSASLAAPLAAQAGNPTQLVRRIGTTALLAAQEYALGFEGGRVVSTAEIDEARLFLGEAIRAAEGLPAESAGPVRAAMADALAMVERTAPADSVAGVVRAAVDALTSQFGVVLDEAPAATPSLALGAQIYQAQCASCHGALGAGDGQGGRGLMPPPANLADAGALTDASPLDFYRRTSIGIAGTAMPPFEGTLTVDERWAVALYASTLRLPAPEGGVPPALSAFATTGNMSDAQVLAGLGPGATLAGVAAVRSVQSSAVAQGGGAQQTLARVRAQVDSAAAMARAGDGEAARQAAFDAYLTFEGVEREVRVKDPGLATRLEAGFAELRDEASRGSTARTDQARRDLLADLEIAARVLDDRLAPWNVFLQSLIILLREGLEAILVVGALIAFLVKTGAGSRRRDVHVGVGAALGASMLTAVAFETVFRISPARQEVLEGFTMVAAAVMLFYVSYWLLSKIEVAKWNQFVRSKVNDAVTSGSALALATVAFLAVYREGFETVLFYKALAVSSGAAGLVPIAGGIAIGAVLLAVVYIAINRFGVRIPLKPFFGVTSAFLYYMAFVFAGKAVAELQEGGLVGTTVVEWAPRIPMMGIYPTVESLAAQGLLVALAFVALGWIFLVAPARRRARQAALPRVANLERDVLRSLDRIEADVSEIRAEVERLRDRLVTAQEEGKVGKPAN